MPVLSLGDALQAIAQGQADILQSQMPVHQRCHLKIQWGYHLVEHLYDCDVHAAMHEILRHFQADESTAYHHGCACFPRVYMCFDGVHIRDGAQLEDAWEINPRHRWHEGSGARGQN